MLTPVTPSLLPAYNPKGSGNTANHQFRQSQNSLADKQASPVHFGAGNPVPRRTALAAFIALAAAGASAPLWWPDGDNNGGQSGTSGTDTPGNGGNPSGTPGIDGTPNTPPTTPANSLEPEPSLNADDKVTLDYNNTKQVYSMSGLLNGFNPWDGTTPKEDKIKEIVPQMWRAGSTYLGAPGQMKFLDTMRGIPARVEFILSEGWGSPSAEENKVAYQIPDYAWVSPHQHLGEWKEHVSSQIDRFGSKIAYFDVWNEPDLSTTKWQGSELPTIPRANATFDGSLDDFVETYAAAYQAIRGKGLNTPVGGPSLTNFNEKILTDFLDKCLKKGVQVNFLSWHEINEADEKNDFSIIKTHIDKMNSILSRSKYKPLQCKEIHINEIVGEKSNKIPGNMIANYYYAEQGGANKAAKATIGEQYSNNTLGGLLESPSAYAAQKVYAEASNSLNRDGALQRPTPTAASKNGNIVPMGHPNRRIFLVGYGDASGSARSKDIQLTVIDKGLKPGETISLEETSIEPGRVNDKHELGSVKVWADPKGVNHFNVLLKDLKPGELRRVDVK